MAVVDENAAALGVPRRLLMESSGNAVARVVREVTERGDTVAVIAGRGNNGGDAFAAVRFLDGYDVAVHLLGRGETIRTEIARDNWATLDRCAADIREVRDSREFALGDPSVVVDAMLGTGVSGPPSEPEATAIERVNASEATVVSVDVPSGLDADTGEAPGVAVEADHVVTFHDTKPGLSDLAATVTVADIGIPHAAEQFVERGDLRRLSRDPQAHKGEHGDVLVIGGGPFTGAPTLAARAALRAGVDLAFVACPDRIAGQVQAASENLILRPFEGERLEPRHVEALLVAAADHDAVIIGPGLGDEEATLTAVGEFLEAYDGLAVVDADALQTVPGIETGATMICTPHQAELLTMGGETADDWRERTTLVESFAAELGHVLLVTGTHDIVSDGEVTRVNRSGNAGMTVGGTGDVLAGAAGALACRLDPHDAAAVAAYATGKAGDAVARQHGDGLVATDLLAALPGALWGERT